MRRSTTWTDGESCLAEPVGDSWVNMMHPAHDTLGQNTDAHRHMYAGCLPTLAQANASTTHHHQPGLTAKHVRRIESAYTQRHTWRH